MKRFVIMGAGEVGRYLARCLSGSSHAVTLIDSDPAKQRVVEERLDVCFVLGNGTHAQAFEAAATASITTLSNVGPGLGRVGPTTNFAFFSDGQTLVMVLLMWLGRLEFFAILALADRRFWRH